MEGQKSWGRLLGRSPFEQTPVPQPKPAEFNVAFRTARALAYQCCDGDARETSVGGVLGAGQHVWVAPRTVHLHTGRVQAFVDVLGLVVIDRRGLVRVRAAV